MSTLPWLAAPAVVFMAFLAPLCGQDARLLTDVNLTPESDPSSIPTDFAVVQGGVVFWASRRDIGRELWFTDGTSAGTRLVQDIYPGLYGGWIRGIASRAQIAYFAANDGVHGAELFSSDGTAGGTSLLADIRAGTEGSDPRDFTVATNFVYFSADDGNHGRELWRTDGTPAGTSLVADVGPGIDGFVGPLFAWDDEVWFVADDGVHGRELWHSDGSAAGTAMVADIEPGSAGSDPATFAGLGNELWFSAQTTGEGRELWKSDGSVAGTLLVADLNAGTAGSSPHDLVVAGSTLFFVAHRGLPFESDDLWTVQSGSIRRLRDSDPNLGTLPEDLIAVGTSVYYTAFHSFYGRELWTSDGTPAGTLMVGDLNPGPVDSTPHDLTAIGGSLWFTANVATLGREPWVALLGTAQLVSDIVPGSAGSGPSAFIAVPNSNLVVFSALQPATGRELWASDGTGSGTALIANIDIARPGATLGSEVQRMLAAMGTLYFTVDDGVHGYELWRSDGTTPGTGLLADIHPGTGGYVPILHAAIGDTIYFGADDGVHGYELWRANTRTVELVADLDPGTSRGFMDASCAIGARFFFTADDGTTGTELWVTAGTAASTRRVADLRPGSASSRPTLLTNVNGVLYFFADAVGGSTWELWRSDGTESNTTMLYDFPVGVGTSVARMVAFGRSAVFIVGPSTAYELWRSDGTPAGTSKLHDVGAISGGDAPDLAVWNGRIWFEADDGMHGRELWVSDGTVGGTTLFADIHPGAASGDIESLAAGVDLLWFFAVDAQGVGAYCSDGTLAGTRRLIDLGPYPWSCCPTGYFVPVGTRRASFRAQDPTMGNSLFISDGTLSGTHRIDVVLGSSGPWAEPLGFAAGRLFFVADDGFHGREPWVCDPGATAELVGLRCTTRAPAPLLSATDPVLGGSSHITATNGPAQGVGVLLFGVPVPAPLPVLGCALSIDPMAFMPITSPTAVGDMPIPGNPSFAGVLIALQTWYLSSGPPLEVSASNAVYLKLGQ